VCLFALVFLASTTTASAQGQGNGILTGTVADNAGVVPGATITATDSATGLVRSSPSNDQGVFRLLSLPPGKYSLRVEMEGFKEITLTDIMLLSGETRDVGRLVLSVGVRTESITVTAETTPVQIATSSLQKTVTG